MADKPGLCLISTGGTIAGQVIGGAYEAAKLTPEFLLASVPQAQQIARWKVVQPYNIGSQHALLSHFLKLRLAVLDALSDPLVDAVLLTHGTDTMEEMIYFLYATLPVHLRTKPVIITGSMLPADHPQADGPRNILDSTKLLCKVLRCTEYQDKSLLAMCMNGSIIEPMKVSKSHTHHLNTFDVPGACHVSEVLQSKAELLGSGYYAKGPFAGEFAHLRMFGKDVLFEQANQMLQRPKIGFLYCRPDLSDIQFEIDRFLEQQVEVVVLATYGNGNLPGYWEEPLAQLIEAGVRLVRGSRVHAGGLTAQTEPCGLDHYEKKLSAQGRPMFSKGLSELSLPQLIMRERLLCI